MKKYSKSNMTREQEDAYDEALKNFQGSRSNHFAPGTTVICGYRKATVLGHARHIMWVWWDDGGTEMITPMAIHNWE